MNFYRNKSDFYRSGFTLVELAIVLVVVSLLLMALMGPLAAQQEQKAIMDTKRQMDEAKEALFGFLVSNGRLPCPANPALLATNANAGIAAATCAAGPAEVGVLPWRTLGLKEVDGWNHRFTYRVASTFATPPNVASVGNISLLPQAGSATQLTSVGEAVAVIVSHGHHADGAWGVDGIKLPDSADADEAENSNIDQTFVDHANTATQPTSPYDDIVLWIPRNLVFNKLIAAGRLP